MSHNNSKPPSQTWHLAPTTAVISSIRYQMRGEVKGDTNSSHIYTTTARPSTIFLSLVNVYPAPRPDIITE